jgi:uncharacterized protein (DUF302 family)
MKHFTALLLRALLATSLLARAEPVVEYSVRGSFDDVKQMLVIAIENHGLVVNHESKVGEMLERTGKDLGAAKQIYLRAEVLEFCSATLSRQAMEADARLLAYCPYGIGIYVLPKEPDVVHIVYRRPRADGIDGATQVLKQVDELLNAIAKDAAQ